MTTSATGGYLIPTNTVVDDRDLRRVIHGFIVGVTGLDEEKVRPAWQKSPAAIESNGVDWCAFALNNFEAGQAYQVYSNADDDTAFEQHETFDVVASFYGDNCERYSAMIRDGLQLGQNREALWLQSVSLVNAPKITHVPELVNTVWQDRCDVVIGFARTYTRRYDILSFLSADGDVITDTDITIPWITAGLFDYTFDETFQ
jgi:hypothetical protein